MVRQKTHAVNFKNVLDNLTRLPRERAKDLPLPLFSITISSLMASLDPRGESPSAVERLILLSLSPTKSIVLQKTPHLLQCKFVSAILLIEPWLLKVFERIDHLLWDNNFSQPELAVA